MGHICYAVCYLAYVAFVSHLLLKMAAMCEHVPNCFFL